MFSEQEPAEQQSEWRHHEVIGTRGGRTRYRKHAEPEQVSEHRDEENQIRKRCEQAPGRSAGNGNSAGPSRAEDERRISGGNQYRTRVGGRTQREPRDPPSCASSRRFLFHRRWAQGRVMKSRFEGVVVDRCSAKIRSFGCRGCRSPATTIQTFSNLRPRQ